MFDFTTNQTVLPVKKNTFSSLLLKAVFLTAALFLALFYLSFLFIDPSVWDHFYEQQEESVEVLVLGNSHANLGMDLDILNAKLSANAVSLATKGQNVYQAYYNALEAYNYQSPKVLIIENFLFYERLTLKKFKNQDPTLNDYKKRFLSYDGKRPGRVKIKEGKNFLGVSALEVFFPIIEKHYDWTNLKALKERVRAYLKAEGAERKRSTTIMTEEKAKKYQNTKNFKLEEFNLLPDEQESLDAIVDLALANGTEQVILLTLPIFKEYRNKVDYASLEIPLKTFANQHDKVRYLDLNQTFPKLDRTYFSNDPVGYNQHLNYKGAIVMSNFLASFMQQDYSFDHRNYSTPEDVLYGNHKIPDNAKGNLERINGTKKRTVSIKQGKSVVRLEGWMAVENVQSSDIAMFVALKKNNEFVYITTTAQLTREKRRDVSRYFGKETLYDDSGFSVAINTQLLEKGTYDLSLVCKYNGAIFTKPTHKKVNIL